MVVAKYGILRKGWEVPSPTPCSLPLWKGIVSSGEMFSDNIKYKVGTGDGIFFWSDLWIGSRPLAVEFLDFFRCARDRFSKVSSYWDWSGTQVC